MHYYGAKLSYFLFTASCSDPSKLPSICLKGTYSTTGKTGCTNCSKGFMCPSNGLDSQVPCGNGTFANETKSVECKTCPVGYRCPRSDQDPIECSSGSYSLGGKSTCDTCPAGYR